MSTTTTITIQLEQPDYDRLLAEAERRGVPPESIAREIVHASLATQLGSETPNERVERALKALEELRRITSKMPPVDAVAIAWESREELARRPDITWPSS